MKKMFILIVISFCLIFKVEAQTKVATVATNQYGDMQDGDMMTSVEIPKDISIKIGDVLYFRKQNAYNQKGNRVALNSDYFPSVSSTIVFSYQKDYTTYVTDLKTGEVYTCHMTFRKCYVKKIWYE